jgi:ABC-type glycerol-3-phosphate transport system substrate-binding protein
MVLSLFFAVSGLFAGARSDTSKTDGNKAGSLTIWSAMTQPERIKSFQDLADAYMRGNPDVKITIEVMPWAGMLDKLVASHMAGNPPDITLIPNSA